MSSKINVPGKPSVFSAEEEECFVHHCIVASEFGFPIDTFDLRCIVKSYLDRQGRNVYMPLNATFHAGKDWAVLFLKHHKQLSIRL